MTEPEEHPLSKLGPSFLEPVLDKILSALELAAPEHAELRQIYANAVREVHIDDRPSSFATGLGFVTGSWWACETLWCVAFAHAAWAPELERAMGEFAREADIFRTDTGKLAKLLLIWAERVILNEGRLAWPNPGWPYTEAGQVALSVDDDPEDEDLRAAHGVITRAETLFIGALGWILMHETAHVHHAHGRGITIEEEREADRQATLWLFETAPFGTASERADAMGCALFYMWIRETLSWKNDPDHPPVAERIISCLEAADVHRNAWSTCTLAAMAEVFFTARGEHMPGAAKADFATCDAYLKGVIAYRSKAARR